MALVLLFLPLLAVPTLVFAQNNQQQTTILPKTETVNHSYFASGNQVILSGTVNGDAYLAGGSVFVDGTINGDLLVAGGNIDIRGNVAGNIRAVGGQTTVGGEVGRNVSIAGGSVNISPGAKINGDFVAAAGSASIFGPIAKGATVTTGQTTIGSSIGGDVNATGQINLTSGADINGNLTYLSTIPAQIDPAAKVSGQVTQNQPPPGAKAAPEAAAGAFAGAKFLFSLMSLVSYLILGLILFSFMPVFGRETSRMLMERPWMSLGIGFLITIIIPIIIFLLFITVLGIPLAFFLIALFVIGVFLSKLIVALAIGRWVLGLFNSRGGLLWALVAGLIIYEILAFIPIIGWLVTLLAMFFGLGALYLERKQFSDSLRSKKLM